MSTSQWNSNQQSEISQLNNQEQGPQTTSKIWLLGAFSSAVAATLCCLPALLFLLFGSSFGLLSLVGPLEKFRILLSVLALLCFAAFIWAHFFRQRCGLNRGLRGRRLALVVLVFFGLILLLFYPELLGAFYRYE
ncbi:MAG: hypothetical protein Q4G44_01460 [Alcaligenaceae bacterium]|nr:hypothetical protein [Alcaligenaceae bacterium]